MSLIRGDKRLHLSHLLDRPLLFLVNGTIPSQLPLFNRLRILHQSLHKTPPTPPRHSYQPQLNLVPPFLSPEVVLVVHRPSSDGGGLV